MFPLMSLNCWRKGHNDDKGASVLSMGRRPVRDKERPWVCRGEKALLGPTHVTAEEARPPW